MTEPQGILSLIFGGGGYEELFLSESLKSMVYRGVSGFNGCWAEFPTSPGKKEIKPHPGQIPVYASDPGRKMLN